MTGGTRCHLGGRPAVADREPAASSPPTARPASPGWVLGIIEFGALPIASPAAGRPGPRRLRPGVLAEAAGFAFLSALSPTALLVAAIFLRSVNPRRTILFFLCGAVLVTLAVGVVLFVVLRAGGLSQPDEREARYALRLGLGVLALGVSVLLAVRTPPPNQDKKPSRVMRLAAQPGPRSAFTVGLLVFIPGVTYVASVQVVATTAADPPLVVLALTLVVAIDVTLAWLPLLLFIAAPEATRRRLDAVNGRLHAHGRQVLVAATTIAGLALLLDGAAGLAS